LIAAHNRKIVNTALAALPTNWFYEWAPSLYSQPHCQIRNQSATGISEWRQRKVNKSCLSQSVSTNRC